MAHVETIQNGSPALAISRDEIQNLMNGSINVQDAENELQGIKSGLGLPSSAFHSIDVPGGPLRISGQLLQFRYFNDTQYIQSDRETFDSIVGKFLVVCDCVRPKGAT